MNRLLLIISREYTIRVKKKGFIITTLLMPLLIVGMMFAPTLLIMYGSDGPSAINVIDRSGLIGVELLQNGSIAYNLVEGDPDELLADDSYQNLLVIGENAVDDPSQFVLFTRESGSIETEGILRKDLKDAIENIRLQSSGIDNIKELLARVSADVTLSTRTLDRDGNAEASDTLTSFVIGMVMAFVLYMFILIYGQLVMQSIIEEKNNRVIEIIVTSVKPWQLMVGKIVGVGAVAVTQVAIWGLLVSAFIAFGLPAIAGHDIFGELEALRNGTLDMSSEALAGDLPLLQALAVIDDLGYIFSIAGWLILFLLGGFLLFAAIYAAVGASVDNAQDGAQLQSFALVPVILGLVVAMSAASNPGSDIAFWGSMIPLTSPMVMMSRIPSGLPLWQILLSLALLYATVALVVWGAARIYRIGIFMYGKKPTLKELMRWMKVK